MRNSLLFFLIVIVVLSSCNSTKDDISPQQPLLYIPEGFPTPDFPEDNTFTEARWKLGKSLFFDQRFSQDKSVSCASCHLPAFAFSDTSKFSPGAGHAPGVRNSPSLANVAYHPYFTREGGVPSLEMQVLVPIQEHNEFNSNILEIAEILREDEELQMLSVAAYDREIDYYVIPRALATFERTLISGESKYDLQLSDNSKDLFSEQEKLGMELFFSEKTHCFSCHSGFNFTNYEFENNGLYLEYDDPGRFRLTNEPGDRALFKVPSLRNTEVTAPYMHDGSIKTLSEVVEHYNDGGKPHPNKNNLIRPLQLTTQEKDALVAFIKTLTDEKFINNEKFRNN